MPLTGACAWKEVGIGPEERIDRFFNLIDHAVDNGVALDSLYNRKHLKDFLLYTLHQAEEFCKTSTFTLAKDLTMPNITVTSLQESELVVGDPGFYVIKVPPKGTKEVSVTTEQLRLLTPHLDRLKNAKWLIYSVGDVAAAAAPVEAPPSQPPPPASNPDADCKTEDPPPDSDDKEEGEETSEDAT